MHSKDKHTAFKDIKNLEEYKRINIKMQDIIDTFIKTRYIKASYVSETFKYTKEEHTNEIENLKNKIKYHTDMISICDKEEELKYEQSEHIKLLVKLQKIKLSKYLDKETPFLISSHELNKITWREKPQKLDLNFKYQHGILHREIKDFTQDDFKLLKEHDEMELYDFSEKFNFPDDLFSFIDSLKSRYDIHLLLKIIQEYRYYLKNTQYFISGTRKNSITNLYEGALRKLKPLEQLTNEDEKKCFTLLEALIKKKLPTDQKKFMKTYEANWYKTLNQLGFDKNKIKEFLNTIDNMIGFE